MRVVICGGGVIGASIAYFLSRRGVAAIVVERTGVACAASGKSGGFLALDWCDGNAMGPLARRSYALHEALAAESNVDWGYRALDTLGVVARARGRVDRYRRHAGPAWLGPDAAVHGQLGTTATTAQVHPAAFTRAMADGAVMGGAQLRAGRVTGVALTPDGTRATGVEVDGEIVAADAVVIAMGPWSVLACQWLPLPAIHGLKGHSIVVRPDPSATPHALFVEYEAADGEVDAPEVVPRPDGTTYVSGLSSDAALPVDPADVAPEAGAEDALRAMAARVAPALGQAEILATPGLLPADRSRRAAAAWTGAGGRRCLRRHRPQLLGHPECAGQRRGNGGADRRRRRDDGRPDGVRPGTAGAAARR